MFQSLRLNSPVYLLYKGGKPRVELGYVTTQPIPKSIFPSSPSTGYQQNTVVDLVVKVNNRVENYNSIPGNLDVADCFYNGENVIVATSKDGVTTEINNLKQKALDNINSYETNVQLVKYYDELLMNLNPELKEQQKQQEEINGLKSKMEEMSNNMSKLMEMNKQLVEQLSKKE